MLNKQWFGFTLLILVQTAINPMDINRQNSITAENLYYLGQENENTNNDLKEDEIIEVNNKKNHFFKSDNNNLNRSVSLILIDKDKQLSSDDSIEFNKIFVNKKTDSKEIKRLNKLFNSVKNELNKKDDNISDLETAEDLLLYISLQIEPRYQIRNREELDPFEVYFQNKIAEFMDLDLIKSLISKIDRILELLIKDINSAYNDRIANEKETTANRKISLNNKLTSNSLFCALFCCSKNLLDEIIADSFMSDPSGYQFRYDTLCDKKSFLSSINNALNDRLFYLKSNERKKVDTVSLKIV